MQADRRVTRSCERYTLGEPAWYRQILSANEIAPTPIASRIRRDRLQSPAQVALEPVIAAAGLAQ